MPVRWSTPDEATFTIVDHQGIAGKVFGGLMLSFGALPMYWLGTAIAEYIRLATWKQWLTALPGMVLSLFLAALFVVPGALMGFLARTTRCSKNQGVIRQTTSVFFLPIRRKVEIPISEVTSVHVGFKRRIVKGAGKGVARRSGRIDRLLTVDLRRGNKQPLDVAHERSEQIAKVLAWQLADFLGVEGPPLSPELAALLGAEEMALKQ